MSRSVRWLGGLFGPAKAEAKSSPQLPASAVSTEYGVFLRQRGQYITTHVLRFTSASLRREPVKTSPLACA